ncbi:MAG: Hsp20/alpha crystallin family protein [Halobacteriales archaeon]|nr:Hsp20/alpha crystallin family protein [Halobacteriales archaeon]
MTTGSNEYDLYEQDGEFVLSVEMPGFQREDIDIGWNDGRLTIAAKTEKQHRDQPRTYRRTFRIRAPIQSDEIQAKYENGILDIYLPTSPETTEKGTSIPVQ